MTDIQKKAVLKQQKKPLEKKFGQSLGKVETQVRSSANQVQKQVRHTISSLTWKIYVTIIFLIVFGVLIPRTYYINQEWQRAIETRTDLGVFLYEISSYINEKWLGPVDTNAESDLKFIRFTDSGLHFKLPFIEKYQQYRIDFQQIQINNVTARTKKVKVKTTNEQEKITSYELNANIVLLYSLPKDEIHLKTLHNLKHKKENPFDFQKALEIMLTSIFKAKISQMRMRDIPKERKNITKEVLKTLELFKNSDFHTKKPEEILKIFQGKYVAQQVEVLKSSSFPNDNDSKEKKEKLDKIVTKMISEKPVTKDDVLKTLKRFRDSNFKPTESEVGILKTFQGKYVAQEVLETLKLPNDIVLKEKLDNKLAKLLTEKTVRKVVLEIRDFFQYILDSKEETHEILTKFLTEPQVAQPILNTLELHQYFDLKEKIVKILTNLLTENQADKEIFEILELINSIDFSGEMFKIKILTELFAEKAATTTEVLKIVDKIFPERLLQKPVTKEVKEVLARIDLLKERIDLHKNCGFKEKFNNILVEFFQDQTVAKNILKILKRLKNKDMDFKEKLEKKLAKLFKEKSVAKEVLETLKLLKNISFKEKLDKKLAELFKDKEVVKSVLKTLKQLKDSAFNTIELYDFSMPYYDWSEEFRRDIRYANSTKKEMINCQKEQQDKYIKKKEEIEENIKVAQAQTLGEVKKIKAQSQACFNTSTADIEANIKKMIADADADAIRLRGEAQAAVLQAQAQILAVHPGLVELEAIKRWDGKLPECQTLEEMFTFINQTSTSQTSSNTLLTIEEQGSEEKFEKTEKLCTDDETDLLKLPNEVSDNKDETCEFALQQISLVDAPDKKWCVDFQSGKDSETLTLCCDSD